MKTKVLFTLTLASLLAIGTANAPKLTANADEELRYFYPEIETCSITSEQIPCTDMNETETAIQYEVPFYVGTGDLTNCCGAIAGAIIVGYYDRYYPDLIANWTPYYSNGMYKYADGTYVPAVIQELYTLMRTNVDDVGVSQYDCRNGLQTYFTNRGRTLTYSNIESNNTFNMSLYQQSIAQNKPVLMFCNNVTISRIGYSSDLQIGTITSQSISGGHIVVGYGYTTVNYYNNGTLFRSDNYLRVSTGRNSLKNAYINISSTSWLVDGYSVSVS